MSNAATSKLECALESCARPVKRAGLCYSHYMKQWRYGTPTPVHAPRWEDAAGQRFGTLVAVERRARRWLCRCDCGAERLASLGELRRAGDTNRCGIPGRHLAEVVGYGAAHDRVRRANGSASGHACVDCGGRAAQWSYDHEDPDEIQASGLSAGPISYSVKPEHYVPRCISCHKLFDLSRG